MSRIIDLSLPIFEGMPHYPTDPPTLLSKAKSIAESRTRVTLISFGSHTGTHVDVPAHIFEGGRTLEQVDLSSFMGKAVKLRLDRFSHYDLKGLDYDGLLLETGWGQYYSEPDKYHGPQRPDISPSVIDSLLARPLRFFGCDLPSADRSGAPEKFVHSAFLSRNVVIYENLSNLEQLPEALPFTFIGLPLNIMGIDGSPVRAIAILD